MKNLFSLNPKITKEAKIILLLMSLFTLLRAFLGKDLNQLLFCSLAGVLIGMLYMHLYDVRKFKRDS